MTVTVDTSVAEKLLQLIEQGDYQEQNKFYESLEQMKSMKGIQHMLDFYRNVFQYDAYKEILFKALNHLDYQIEDESLQMMYDQFVRLSDNLDLVRQKIALIKQFDFSAAFLELEETLPDHTDIQVEIYFLFDGINGGSIVGSHTMLLNTMFWPSQSEYEPIIKEVLLHEYHHLGVKYWLNQAGFTDELIYQDSEHMLMYFTAEILGEGAATYFFTNSDNLYPLVYESHGPAFAETFRKSVTHRHEEIDQLLLQWSEDLTKVSTGSMTVDDFKKLSVQYSFDISGKEPIDKSIGYHICKTIDQTLGRKVLIECLKTPQKVFDYYNQARQETIFKLEGQTCQIKPSFKSTIN